MTQIRPRRHALLIQRSVLVPFVLFAFAVSQLTGWSVFATNFADGSVRRAVQATTGSTAREELERLRALQKKTGVTRPVATVEAEIEAALNVVVRSQGKTVGELTQSCGQPGWAPVTCKKVGELRAELATAREAATLPQRIAAALHSAQSGPQVADGSPYLDYLSKVFGGATPADILFWLVLGFVGGIGTIANAGPGLLRATADGGGDRHKRMMRGAAWAAVIAAFALEVGANALFGYKVAGVPAMVGMVIIACIGAYCGLALADTINPILSAAAPPHAGFGGLLPPVQSPGGGTPAGGSSWSPPAGPGPGQSAAPGPQQFIIPPTAHQISGAPINITVGGSMPEARAADVAASVPPRSASQRRTERAETLPAVVRRAAPDAPSVPVARGRVQALIDMVLTFEAACLPAHDDGTVSGDDVYRAFVAWGRGRTMPIHTLFELLDGYSERARRVDVGGRVHFSGVRLAEVAPQRLHVVGE